METRSIGSLKVSVVGLGCNNFGRRLDGNDSAGVVNAALEAGITLFDTADVYGSGQSEAFLGRALGLRRNQVVIATKFGMAMEGQGSGAKPDYIRIAVEASLRRLSTHYIDLYQLHKPDPEVPIEDTLGALNDLVQAGKVREIGCSQFSLAQMQAAQAAIRNGAARFVSVQNEYSLLERQAEKDVLPECTRTGTAFLPFFPLARGLLTGKYRQGQAMPTGTRITSSAQASELLNERTLSQVEALARFAEAHGHSLLELAFSWLLRWPILASVIAGAMTAEQITANVAAANWHLTEADLTQIDSILAPP